MTHDEFERLPVGAMIWNGHHVFLLIDPNNVIATRQVLRAPLDYLEFWADNVQHWNLYHNSCRRIA